MSVFIGGDVTEEICLNKKTRKKYYTKYNVKYQEEYPWAFPSSKGELHASCQLCDVDICIKSVGAKGLRDHEATCKHNQKAHQMGLKPSLPLLGAPTISHQRFTQQNHSFVSSNEPSLVSHAMNPSRNIGCASVLQNDVPSYASDVNTFSPSLQTYAVNNGTLRGQPQLQSQHSNTLPSSIIYPVLEVAEIESQPTCRTPQSPQTPNTPSTPFHQDHFSSANVKAQRGVDCEMSVMQCQIPEEMLPTSNAFQSIKNANEGTMTLSHYQNMNQNMASDSREMKGYILPARISDREYILPSTDIPTNSAPIVKEDISRESVESSPGNSEGDPTEQEDNNNGSANWTLDDAPKSKSSALSVEDLTCNICGEVFLDWKELKKDLLEHVKEAQKNPHMLAASPPAQVETNSKKKKKPAAGTKWKKSPLLPNANVSKSFEKRKRGRPLGSKKKGQGQSQPPQDDSNLSSALNDASSNASDNSMLESLITPSPKVLKKRGRPAKVKPVPIEMPAGDPSLCQPGDDGYWGTDLGFSNSNSTDHLLERPEEKSSNVQQASAVAQPTSRRSGQLQCRVCKGMFYLRQELRDHYKNEHNNGRPYECDICHKFFSTRNHLQVHNKHKHEVGPNPCLCSICGKTLSSRTNLKIHMMIHKGERPFSCPECNQQFSRKANMEMHKVYHSGERKFTCEVCGQGFFAINALKRHKKLHTGERDYECDVCGASYVTGTDLRRHRLKHEDVKPFPCNLCEKQFTRAHDLKVHLRYHNKELRFTCNICGKQFVESGNFRRHMRRHTGERPYVCDICQQTFSQVHHFKVHMRTNHSEQDGSARHSSSTQGPSSSQRNLHLQKGTIFKKGTKMAPSTTNHMTVSSQLNGALVATAAGMKSNSMSNHLHGVQYMQNSSSSHSGPVTQISSDCSIPHTLVSHSVTVTPPVAHVNNAGMATMVTSHPSQVPPHNPTSAGFLQYNSYIYNTSVIPQYPTLFDMCPQQPPVGHIGPS